MGTEAIECYQHVVVRVGEVTVGHHEPLGEELRAGKVAHELGTLLLLRRTGGACSGTTTAKVGGDLDLGLGLGLGLAITRGGRQVHETRTGEEEDEEEDAEEKKGGGRDSMKRKIRPV